MIICPPTRSDCACTYIYMYSILVHVHAPAPPKFRVHPTYPVTHAAVIVIIRCLVAGFSTMYVFRRTTIRRTLLLLLPLLTLNFTGKALLVCTWVPTSLALKPNGSWTFNTACIYHNYCHLSHCWVWKRFIRVA